MQPRLCNNQRIMASSAKPFLTPEQYLKQERAAEFRSEYLAGEVFAMSGATRYHGRIVMNAGAEIRDRLKKRTCNVYASDLRVYIPLTGLYTYPDVVVTCGEENYLDGEMDTLLNPVLLIEVLSPSTSNYDRGDKFVHYRSIPSLSEYLTISQDKMMVEHRAKQPNQSWLLIEYSKQDDRIHLESINVDLAMADLYEKVEWPANK